MSSIVANSIRTSNATASVFSSITANTAVIATQNTTTLTADTVNATTICVGSGASCVQIAAAPTVPYKITLPPALPIGLRYFGFNGTTYQWMPPTVAGLPTTGVNSLIGTDGTSFVVFAPSAVCANIGAQPLAPTLTQIARMPLYANAIFGTDSASNVNMMSAGQVLAYLGLSATSVPVFGGLAVNNITPPAQRLTVGSEVVALPGTTSSSLVTLAQLNAAATGAVQQSPAVAYGTFVGTATTTTVTAASIGPLTVDGVSPAVGSTILLNNLTGAGGIYTVTAAGSSTTKWQLTRSVAVAALFRCRILVSGGAMYGGTSWVCTAAAPNQVVFVQDGTAPTLTPGPGIAINGTTIGLQPLFDVAETVSNPASITINSYGQITASAARTPSQLLADINSVVPTFAAATVGNVRLTSGEGQYTVSFPTSAPTTGNTLVYDGTAFAWSTPVGTACISGVRPSTMLAYTTPPNVSGGPAVPLVWTPYPLNTATTPTHPAGQFAASAGTYNVVAYASFCQVGGCMIRLNNVTTGDVLVQGSTAFSANGTITIDDGSLTRSCILGQITLEQDAILRMEYFVEVSSLSDYELGRATVNTNIHGQIQLQSVSDIVSAQTEDLVLVGSISAQCYRTSVSHVAVVASPVVLAAKFRTYYLAGTPTSTFVVQPPIADDGTEIVVVNATTRVATFATAYAVVSIAGTSKQVFTYDASLLAWI